MEIKIHKDEMSKSMSLVSSIVPSHPSLFVISNMLIEVERNTIFMSATDLDISMRIRQEVEAEESGNAIVPARKLFDVIRELPQDDIVMRREGEKLVIDCGRGHFELQTFPGEDYPSLPKVDFDEALEMGGETLITGIDQTMFAVSKDQARPILTGVLLEVKDDLIGIVATDGHRLARFRKMGSYRKEGKERDLIIPMKALGQMKKLFEDCETIEIAVAKKQIAFRGDGKEMYTRLIEGPFPNYELVIPQNNEKEAVIDKNSLIHATRRMQVIANPTTRRVTFEFMQGQLSLKVTTRDVGQAHETMDIEYDDEPIEISFNASYMEEALKAIEGDKVVMLMSKADSACIMKPHEIAEDEEYFSIIMPLRIMEGEE